jgi:hypothetical protein
LLAAGIRPRSASPGGSDNQRPEIRSPPPLIILLLSGVLYLIFLAGYHSFKARNESLRFFEKYFSATTNIWMTGHQYWSQQPTGDRPSASAEKILHRRQDPVEKHPDPASKLADQMALTSD